MAKRPPPQDPPDLGPDSSNEVEPDIDRPVVRPRATTRPPIRRPPPPPRRPVHDDLDGLDGTNASDEIDREFEEEEQGGGFASEVEDLGNAPSLGGAASARVDALGMGEPTTMPLGRATTPKLWASAQHWPTCTHYRVWKMENGVASALGLIERDISEEDFIRSFLASMPKQGEGRIQFRLRPIDANGVELGAEFPYNISDTHAYLLKLRNGAAPGANPASPFGIPPELFNLFQDQTRLAERRAMALEETLKAQADQRLAEREEIMRERVAVAQESAQGVQSVTERLMSDEAARRDAQLQREMARDAAVRQQLQDQAAQSMGIVTSVLGQSAQAQATLFQQQMELANRAEEARREHDRRTSEAEANRLAARAAEEAENRRREREDSEALRRREREEGEARRREEREEAEAKRRLELETLEHRRLQEREEAERKYRQDRDEYERKRQQEREEFERRRDMEQRELVDKRAAEKAEIEERRRIEREEAEDRRQRERAEFDAKLQQQRMDLEQRGKELELRMARDREEFQLRMQREQQEMETRRERERREHEERERKDRDERERRERLDREERERRERHEAELTGSREKERERQHARQMEEMRIGSTQQREHAERMVALQNTMLTVRSGSEPKEDGLSKAMGVLTMLGIDPKDAAAKLLGGNSGWLENLPKIAAGAAEVLGAVIQRMSPPTAPAGSVTQVRPPFPMPQVPMHPANAPATGAPTAPPGAPAPSGPTAQPTNATSAAGPAGSTAQPDPAAPTPTPMQPKPAPATTTADGLTLAGRRDARNAIRKLVERARRAPETEWEGLILAASMTTPVIIEYLKVTSLAQALAEGGADEALVTRVFSVARQSPVFGPLLAQSPSAETSTPPVEAAPASPAVEAAPEAAPATAPAASDTPEAAPQLPAPTTAPSSEST